MILTKIIYEFKRTLNIIFVQSMSNIKVGPTTCTRKQVHTLSIIYSLHDKHDLGKRCHGNKKKYEEAAVVLPKLWDPKRKAWAQRKAKGLWPMLSGRPFPS